MRSGMGRLPATATVSKPSIVKVLPEPLGPMAMTAAVCMKKVGAKRQQ